MCNQIIAAQCRGAGHASASSHLTPSWYSKYLFVSIHHDRDVLEHQVHPLPVASGVPLKPHLSSSGPAIRGTMGSYDGWSLCVYVCVCVCMCVCMYVCVCVWGGRVLSFKSLHWQFSPLLQLSCHQSTHWSSPRQQCWTPVGWSYAQTNSVTA